MDLLSRGCIDVCYCDMFSVVNVCFDHLKFGVVCINGRRYVCCGYVVSNECVEPTSCLVQPIVPHCCEVMYLWCFDFRGELGFLNCDYICMCVLNKQFELLEFVVCPFMLTCSMMRFLSLLLLDMCACSPVVVLGLSVVVVVALTVMHVCLLRG